MSLPSCRQCDSTLNGAEPTSGEGRLRGSGTGKTPQAAAGANSRDDASDTNGLDQPGVGIAGATAVGGGGEESVDMMKPPEASSVDIRIAMIGNVDRCPGCSITGESYAIYITWCSIVCYEESFSQPVALLVLNFLPPRVGVHLTLNHYVSSRASRCAAPLYTLVASRH